MIRFLILCGTVHEFYQYLRDNKIGWVEAVYINDPTRLRGFEYLPVTKTGTWEDQSAETKAAVEVHMLPFVQDDDEPQKACVSVPLSA